MDHRFQRFEERLVKIVECLDALGIDANRRRNDNRRPEVEAAHGDPIDRPVPAHRQPVYEEDSEEEDEVIPPQVNCYQNQRWNDYKDRWNGYDDRDFKNFRLKVDIPYFSRNLGIEEFLDWIAEIDRFFDYMETLPDKRVKLVACHLKEMASAWWERL